MGALDPVKILAVLVIALIVLGPDKLPKVARQAGAAWRELTKFRDKVEQEVREAIPEVDLPRIPTRPSVAVAGFIADLTAPLKTGLSPSVGQPATDGAPPPEAAASERAEVALAPAQSAVAPPPAPAMAFDDPSMN